jgi:hypothetical protein
MFEFATFLPHLLAHHLMHAECQMLMLGYRLGLCSDAIDRKSISVFLLFRRLFGFLVSCLIALSSKEAEYYATTHAFKETLWLRVFLGLLKFPVHRLFPILSDNQAACSLSNSLAISARSKGIDIRHHFIQYVQAGSFSTMWIPTADMPADIFTKVLPFPIFSSHRDALGLYSIFFDLISFSYLPL